MGIRFDVIVRKGAANPEWATEALGREDGAEGGGASEEEGRIVVREADDGRGWEKRGGRAKGE